MMKKTVLSMHDRIATRAYYLWLAGSTAGAEADWIEAEAVEVAYAERRNAAARKAAETRRAKAAAQVPAEMLVASKGRPGARRLTAH